MIASNAHNKSKSKTLKKSRKFSEKRRNKATTPVKSKTRVRFHARRERAKSGLKMRPIEARSDGRAKKGWFSSLKSMYNDPFKWQMVKSWAFFATGVYIARELVQMDIGAEAPINM